MNNWEIKKTTNKETNQKTPKKHVTDKDCTLPCFEINESAEIYHVVFIQKN